MHRIELSDVEKRFRERAAVKKTDLCLESGVYGLLGENGAGKTTLMRMICGVLRPTGGSIHCDGIEIGQKKNCGSDIWLHMDFLPLHLERGGLPIRSDTKFLLRFLMLVAFGSFG